MIMEFGSDFHTINTFIGHGTSVLKRESYRNAQFLSNGRLCITTLFKANGWKRLWVPIYYCYEVLSFIQKQSIKIMFYEDYPECDDITVIDQLHFQEGDVLLRVNYFGLRKFRDSAKLPIPVIEDHTHDLLGDWARNSTATWCIASLRKTLPIPMGGMIWSPQGKTIEIDFVSTQENNYIATERWNAMSLKRDYLAGANVKKEVFRNIYISTEEQLSDMRFSSIDNITNDYLQTFDIERWYKLKHDNWHYLIENCSSKNVYALLPESSHSIPFSFVLIFPNNDKREIARRELIQHNIYPAILWQIPQCQATNISEYSARMLSIHCDARYSHDDMHTMTKLVKQILDKI